MNVVDGEGTLFLTTAAARMLLGTICVWANDVDEPLPGGGSIRGVEEPGSALGPMKAGAVPGVDLCRVSSFSSPGKPSSSLVVVVGVGVGRR